MDKKALKKEARPLPKKTLKKEPEKGLRQKYFEGIGRRKTSIARVRLFPNQETKEVNGKDYRQYFQTSLLQQVFVSPLESLKYPLMGVVAQVKGGGIASQAEAIRLGISRALVKLSLDNYKELRRVGFLTRDPRMRERKKFGLKRARRAPQWQKR